MGLALLAASGCISFRPPPFERAVAAEALRTIATPAAAPSTTTASLASFSPARAEPDAAPAPARTDVRGAGDGSMKLDVVTITAKDIPHRAPNYSPEQTASMICVAERQGRDGGAARRVHAATLEAKAMRERLAAGTATLKQADDAELDRQSAVLNYRMPIPLLGLFFSPRKKNDLPAPRFGDVLIENPDLYTFKENGKEVIAVTGVVRNAGPGRAELPPLTFEAIDEWDFILAGQTSLLPFEALEPGEARAFELRFNNPPAYTAEVYVHFVPPFGFRSRRDCDFFDPAKFDAESRFDAPIAEAALAPLPEVGEGAPLYTAAELNLLTQYYRRESSRVWRCRDPADKGCSWSAHALNWRDMFRLADAIDEAWIALRAAEESRRRLAANAGTQAEADKAELARQRAIGLFMDMGERALARAGGSVRDVEIVLEKSMYGRDRSGLYVDFAGTMTNTGAEPRAVDALMVAFVDRMELPLGSVAVDFPKTLKPGETARFMQRLQAREQAADDTQADPDGETVAVTVARVPPPNIPWQVRVGAMGR